MAKRGRKSKYLSNVEPYINDIPKLRKQGMTEKQIAAKYGVAYSTFKLYKNKNTALFDALKVGKEQLILELEDTLYTEALGVRVKPTHIEEVKELDRRTGKMIVIKRIEKCSQVPNMTALIFALKNLDSARWQDRRDLNMSVEQDEKMISSIDKLITTISADNDDN